MGEKQISLALGIVVAILFLFWIIKSLVTGAGVPNLIIQNMAAFKRNIPALAFAGKSYEHIQYAMESPAEYLDIYVPDAQEKPPLLILVHGGAFIYDDSQSRPAKLMYQYMRANGYAVATVNYRLAQEARFPAAVCDVKAAVRYLRANAEQYGYDAERFAIWGESAGGYLACMAAFTEDEIYSDVAFVGENQAKPVSGGLSAVVDFYGVLDFDKSISDFALSGVPRWLPRLIGMADLDSDKSIVTKFLGGNIETYTQEQRNALSPTYFAKNLKDKRLQVYIQHGSVDITVPKTQSERLYETLKSALGDEKVTYCEMKNLKHGDDRFYTPKNLKLVKEFLDKAI